MVLSGTCIDRDILHLALIGLAYRSNFSDTGIPHIVRDRRNLTLNISVEFDRIGSLYGQTVLAVCSHILTRFK